MHDVNAGGEVNDDIHPGNGDGPIRIAIDSTDHNLFMHRSCPWHPGMFGG
ncbi:hypothetical protein GALL_391190 [mine drainage metagenome]|uniref:Uncharacterized protein n=1 Tax=mine drainage metagenome TaxID=410659 RepID=A0A1J5Q607_9ZZZZ